MNTIEIKAGDYYGRPSYFSVMPPEIFDALEKAFTAGDKYVKVDKDLFNEMIENYKLKTT